MVPAVILAAGLGRRIAQRTNGGPKALLDLGFGMLQAKEALPATTLDTLPLEVFDAEQVRAANLVKRFKDCQSPEPELDADGNPVCPPAKQTKSAKAAKAAKAMHSRKGDGAKPTACEPPVAAKAKPARPPKVMAKRAPTGTAGSHGRGRSEQDSALH